MIGTTHFTNAVVEAQAARARRRRCVSGCRRPARCRRWSTGRDGCANAVGGARLSLPWRARVRRPRDLAARPGRTARVAARHPRTQDPVGRDLVRVLAGERRAGAAAAAILAEEVPGICRSALARDRPHRPARARERHDHERLPARARRAHRGRVPARARGARDRGAVLHQPERRHADERRTSPRAIRCHVRLRADELHARRGAPLRPRGLRGRRHRRHDIRCRRAATRAFRARRRWRSTSAACGRTSACRTCSRIGLGGGSLVRERRRDDRPRLVGYELHVQGARVRRRRR